MLIVPIIASVNINSNYKKYKKIKCATGKTGFEAAREILDKNGLSNIYIVEVQGELSDCYDPTRKTVKLSTEVFHGKTVASIAIAAHECGHAIQDNEGYSWMRIRSAIFPMVSLANKIAYITLMLGFIFQVVDLIYVSVALTAISLVFQLITLPVEFDASNRAKKLLYDYGIVDSSENDGVKKMLGSAAMTYVAGVLTTLLQMLYYILSFSDRRD